jgi:hypothetical protein
MSVNLPPNPNVATFNNLYWIFNTTQLTQAEADLLYLKFPVAQGAENLQTTNVNGIMTCNDDVNFADGANITTFNQTLTNFTITSANPPLSTATQPASNDSSTKMPTTAWVQSAIAGGHPTDTLSQVLVAGNNAGATDIDMNQQNITEIFNLSVGTGVAPYTNNTTITQNGNDIGFVVSNQALGGTIDFRTNDLLGAGLVNLQLSNETGNEMSGTILFNNDATFSATSDIIQIAGSQILQQPASTGFSTTGNAMNQSVFRTSTGLSGTPLLEIVESTGNKILYFIPNCPNDAYGKLGNAGDFVITPTLLTDLVITNSTSTGGATNGIRVDTSQLLLGYGGVADIPTNNITFDTANGITLTSPVPPLSTAVQPASNDSSTKIPTTAWVQSAIAGVTDTLSQVLVAGNNAGATSIDMNNNNITNVLNLSTSTANFGGDATFSATSDIIQIAGSQILQQPASTGLSTTGNVMNQTILRTSTGLSSAPLLEIIETTGSKNLYFIPNCPNDAYGRLGNAGDFVIAPTAGTNLVITNSAGTATNGIRVDTSQLLLGFGGATDIPTNNITFNTANGITLTSPVPPLSTAVQPASSDSSTKMPTTAWVQSAIASYPIRFNSQTLAYSVSGTPFNVIYNSGGISAMTANTIWKVDIAFYGSVVAARNLLTYIVSDAAAVKVETNSVFGYSSGGYQTAITPNVPIPIGTYCSFTDTFEVDAAAVGACRFNLTGGTSDGSTWAGNCNLSIVLTRLS